MFVTALFVIIWLPFVVAQNVNYTMECVTQNTGHFTLKFTNNGDSVPYFILLDCEGYGNSLFLPPATTVEYPAQTASTNTTEHTSDTCTFWETQVTSGFVSVLARVLGPGYMDMAIEFIYCNTRPNEANVFRFASTTCQEDDKGEVTVLVSNPYDIPLRYYTFWCGEYSDLTGVVPPGSTVELSTVLLDEQDEPPANKCFFSPDFFPEPLMLYFNFETWANNGIEQILNCYKGRPQLYGPKKEENNWKKPIIKLFPNCPSVSSQPFTMEIRVDVPAFGLAKCLNGDRPFTTTNLASYLLPGSFDSEDPTACQFYKKPKSDTYTLDVEIGWGQKSSQVLSKHKMKTITCVYAGHGKSKSSKPSLTEWFISPHELEFIKGQNSTASFELSMLDALGRPLTPDHVTIGKKIRLQAIDTSGSVSGFRALSCSASNGITEYALLRAGCGDGLILPKQSGFNTSGAKAFSPFFEVFTLRGGKSLRFSCEFTVCQFGTCDGSSCPVLRKRRAILGNRIYRVESSWLFQE